MLPSGRPQNRFSNGQVLGAGLGAGDSLSAGARRGDNADGQHQQRRRTAAELFCAFYRREEAFYSSLTEPDLARLFREGLDPRDMRLAGEFLFLAAGAKPCVLAPHFPARADLVDRFAVEVLLPAEGARLDVAPSYRAGLPREKPAPAVVCCRRVDHPLASPEQDWTGAWVVFLEPEATGSPAGPEAAAADLEWTRQKIASVLLNGSRPFVSEPELQELLDYPGSLPATDAEARASCVVSYVASCWDLDWRNDYYLALSYIAQRRSLETIERHFRRYREASQDVFALQLQM